MKIIRGALNAADVSNPNIRYDADCDCLQMSPDGGTTWNDAPGLDPRHAPGFLKPPVSGSSKQCDAAANMVKWLHDFIDEMLFDFELVGTVTTIINSILFELEILAPYIELLAIISELAETISGIGATALAAAFTSDQYDLLQCIFFCNADSSGRVSAAKLVDVENAITAQLNTTAALVTNAILFVQGEIGLSNAGSVGSETGDCSGCDCGWCLEVDLTDNDGGFSNDGSGDGMWTSGIGWQATFTGILLWQLRMDINFTSANINSIDVTYSIGNADGGTNDLARGFLSGSTVWHLNGSIGNGGSGTETVHGAPSGTNTDRILVALDSNNPGSGTVTHIKLKGVSTPPSLTGWTECDV
jgi:hypothetical protein